MAAAVMALACCLSLSGCSLFGLDARTLMRPPRVTGERAGVYDLLEQKGGASLSLCYPAAGDYRSAILLHDLDGDGTEEAIAFYQVDPKDTSAWVLFCKQEKDGWREAGSFENAAGHVDRVCFGDLDGDGSDEVIIGWGSSATGTASICIYREKDGKATETKLSQPYTEMAPLDFDGDGKAELFTANLAADGGRFTASLLRLQDGTAQMMGSALLDAGVRQFSSLKAGNLAADVPGVLLDCQMENGSYLTEMFYWDAKSQSLRTPLYSTSKNISLRSVAVNCMDTNGNGIFAFPVVSRLPGYTGTAADDVGNVVQWTGLKGFNGDYQTLSSAICNARDGYSFLLPDAWKAAITTRYDENARRLSIYTWDAQKNAAGAPLLEIQSLSTQTWQSTSGASGYEQVLTRDDRMIVAQVPAGAGPLAQPLSTLRGNFQTFTQDS